VDGIACSWTLRTIPEVKGALDEMWRVLRPEGTPHFIEHGRFGHQGGCSMARPSEAATACCRGPLQPDRQIDQLIEPCLAMKSLERFEVREPRVMTSTFLGVTKPRK
jgi:ubiquinone/menaquinone biosynthesis C-methylase UbiE